jgi:SCF-associated factor 1
VLWPYHGPVLEAIRKQYAVLDEEGKHARASADVIPCDVWDLERDPTILPALPPLPDLPGTGYEGESKDSPTQLTQIAGLDNCLIGLTNKGHVVKFDNLHNENTAHLGRWEYVELSSVLYFLSADSLLQLPRFSEVESVKQHPTFVQRENYTPQEAPLEMQITHVGWVVAPFAKELS